MKTIKVQYSDDGKKLNTFLTSQFPNLNINTIYKTLRKKDIKINGKRINENVEIHYNDILEIYITDDDLNGIKSHDIPKIYEDSNIVIFNKPINMEVEGNSSIKSFMNHEYNYLEPCHRIDRNTIGLVVFAKNELALKSITEKFKNHNVEKHYIACCYGIPKSNATLSAYLFKDSKKSLVYISKEPKKGYTKIQTSYKLIDSNSESKLSLLDVTLHTGKTHQIRAHLAFAGLPILGDGKYGSYEINKKFKTYSQLLASYSIKFNVENKDDVLYYLNNQTFSLKKKPFTNYI